MGIQTITAIIALKISLLLKVEIEVRFWIHWFLVPKLMLLYHIKWLTMSSSLWLTDMRSVWQFITTARYFLSKSLRSTIKCLADMSTYLSLISDQVPILFCMVLFPAKKCEASESLAAWMMDDIYAEVCWVCIGHLENIHSLSYEDLSDVDTFHYRI